MRQRGVKNREQIIEDCSEYLVRGPREMKGKWNSPESGLWNAESLEYPLFLEIGSGKGQFISNIAERCSKGRFLACEGGQNIFIRILQKAAAKDQRNLRVISEYIIEPLEYFEPGELKGIYINFCDPWPKDGHAHRRLTHRNKLLAYQKLLTPGGFLQFKTDNDALFEWSLEEFKVCGLTPSIVERDLWHSPYEEGNLHTEYEEKFAGSGKTINLARIDF